VNSLLFELKTSELQNGERPYVESKANYMIQLISTIMEKLDKQA
jgi:hypothetical protein